MKTIEIITEKSSTTYGADAIVAVGIEASQTDKDCS